MLVLAGVVAFSACLGPRSARAQQLALKRALPSDSAPACPRMSRPVVPSWAQREQARRLMVLGHEAAIVGDYAAARDHFKQASQLDPTDENIAYELARAYEGTHDIADAAKEYCRYLSLAPGSPEAGDVRAHIATLAPEHDPAVPAPAVARFRAGLDHFDHRRWSAADSAFSAALALAPAWAEPYYDRALARTAAGDSRRAIADLERYLQLEPNADDQSAVTERIASLRHQRLDPSVAFASGLVPGAGQFYTRRPALGFLVLGAALGAAYWGLQRHPVTVTRTARDPNGYPYEYSLMENRRTHLTAGIAVASAVTLLGALEAYVHAKRAGRVSAASNAGRRAGPAVSSFTAEPLLASGGLGMGLTVSLPFVLH